MPKVTPPAQFQEERRRRIQPDPVRPPDLRPRVSFHKGASSIAVYQAAAATPVTGDRIYRMETAQLPRAGDSITTSDGRVTVKHVNWTYSLSQPPRVRIELLEDEAATEAPTARDRDVLGTVRIPE